MSAITWAQTTVWSGLTDEIRGKHMVKVTKDSKYPKILASLLWSQEVFFLSGIEKNTLHVVGGGWFYLDQLVSTWTPLILVSWKSIEHDSMTNQSLITVQNWFEIKVEKVRCLM